MDKIKGAEEDMSAVDKRIEEQNARPNNMDEFYNRVAATNANQTSAAKTAGVQSSQVKGFSTPCNIRVYSTGPRI